jgi:hypothetical protein
VIVYTRELWGDIHAEIQTQLSALETEVRLVLPKVRVDQGRTSGERFYLFSYRTFSVPQSTIDPVVVGMTFTPAREGVTVDADVSGEHTGDIIVSLSPATVANSRIELRAAVGELARALCDSAEAIRAALNDSSRQVD